MKAKILTFVVLSMFAVNSQALRCGGSIVQIGDHEQSVIKKCGKPLSHEKIGYIDKFEKSQRVTALKIEESTYKIKGQFYRLQFEGNILTEINKISRT